MWTFCPQSFKISAVWIQLLKKKVLVLRRECLTWTLGPDFFSAVSLWCFRLLTEGLVVRAHPGKLFGFCRYFHSPTNKAVLSKVPGPLWGSNDVLLLLQVPSLPTSKGQWSQYHSPAWPAHLPDIIHTCLDDCRQRQAIFGVTSLKKTWALIRSREPVVRTCWFQNAKRCIYCDGIWALKVSLPVWDSLCGARCLWPAACLIRQQQHASPFLNRYEPD